jgi:hypothetical protein
MPRLSPANIVFLQKGWQAATGFVTAVLVALFLSPAEQGYYYAIGGLLSGFVLFDLGLSGLLVQVSARLFSGLQLQPGGRISPPGPACELFSGFVARSRRWYRVLAVAVCLLFPAGALYFHFAGSGPVGPGWLGPWLAVVASVALSMPAYPALGIIEGAGQVSEVYLVRLAQYTLGGFLAWALLVSGHGLYAPAMAPLSVAVSAGLWARLRYPRLFGGLVMRPEGASTPRPGKPGFAWRDEVWPLQRRVALTWVAAYLFVYLPTLIVFYAGDAAGAGRLGLTIVVANILAALSGSWLTAQVPRFTRLVTDRLHGEADRLFLLELRRALVLLFLGYGLMLAVIAFAGDLPVVRRLLPASEAGLLFAVFLLFQASGLLGLYFRAHGRERLAAPVLAATLLGLVLAAAGVRRYGIPAVLGSLFGAYLIVCVPAMLHAWSGCRRDLALAPS